MDYTGDTELWQSQWNLIHDLENVAFAWAQDEAEGEMATGTLMFADVIAVINKIREANKENKDELAIQLITGTGKEDEHFELGGKDYTYLQMIATGFNPLTETQPTVTVQSSAGSATINTERPSYKIKPSELSKTTYTENSVKFVKYVFHELETQQNSAPNADTKVPTGMNRIEISVKESDSFLFEKYIYYKDLNGLPLNDCKFRGYSFGQWNPVISTYGCTRLDNDYDCNEDGIEGDKPHHGIDIYASIGTDAFAVASGTVSYVGIIDGYGNTVAIRCSLINKLTLLPQNVYVLYAHLESTSVTINQPVTEGTVIGKTGISGADFLINYPDDYHLHLEIISTWWPSGFNERINPCDFFEINPAQP